MLSLKLLKKNLTLVIIALILIGGVAAALVAGGNDAKKTKQTASSVSGCGPYRKDGIVTIGSHKFSVEIAYNEAARIKGLSGRPCIQSDQGLLFDFGKDGHYRIWMKDMKFPIDVIWIDSKHHIAAIEIDFKPSSYPEQRVNQLPARYVLEVKANTAKDLHLGLGTPVQFQKT